MKKAFVVGAVVICLIGAIGQMLEKRQFRERYLLDSTLILMDAAEGVREIHLGTGAIQRYTFERYSDGRDSPILVAYTNPEKTDVVLYQDGTSKLMFSIEEHVWQQPVLIQDKIYFVASESKERNAQQFVWVFSDGEIKKYHDMPVSASSGILVSGEDLFFVESGETYDFLYDFRIMRKNTVSNLTEFICSGRSPCWEEPGSAFFFITSEDDLAKYDLHTSSSQLINQEVEFRGITNYNASDEILIVYYPDPDNDKSIDIEARGIFYLNAGEVIKYRTYISKMSFSPKEDYYDNNATAFWVD
jgi:hypothetical protein